MEKILNINQLKSLKARYKKKKIILCHGVFDLLHIGHINYFISAKKLGQILVVSVTQYQFVNKGPGRPAFSIDERVKFLSQINCIDYICVSNYLTAEKIIINLKPDYYCKGIDYLGVTGKKDRNLKKELKALKSVKGKFHIIREKNYSSSKTINDHGLQNLSEECKKFIDSIRGHYTLEQILNNLRSIQKKNVLIIGETIIDKYITTEAIGKSGKEPIMIKKKRVKLNF